MAQHEHHVKRLQHHSGLVVQCYDGRGTSTYPLDEFLSYLSHLNEVAAGAPESISEPMQESLAREAEFSPSTVIERTTATALLTRLGLAAPKEIKRRTIG